MPRGIIGIEANCDLSELCDDRRPRILLLKGNRHGSESNRDGIPAARAQDPLYVYLPGDNLYVYSLNNPIIEKDPTGELPLVIGAALIGGLYGTATEGVKAYMDGKGVRAAALRGFCELAKDVASARVAWTFSESNRPQRHGSRTDPFKNRNLLNEPKSVRALRLLASEVWLVSTKNWLLSGLGLSCP